MKEQIKTVFPVFGGGESIFGEAKFILFNQKIEFFIIFLFVLILGKQEMCFSQELSNAGAVANITSGTVVSGGGVAIASGTITNSGTLTLSSNLTNNGIVDGNGLFNIGGNFTNNSVFTAGTNTVIFNGAAPQTIGGTATTSFNDIVLSNASGVSLTQHANLSNELSISSGTFTTSSYSFTLTSNASGTAHIAAIPSGGNFAGNIIMQRYLGVAPTDWRFLSSPVSGATIAEWADDFATSGFVGSSDPSNTFVSINSYDETTSGNLDNGYVPVTNVTDPISNGKGFWVYIGPTPVTFGVTGPPNTFAQSLAVNYTNTGSSADDGWNMVANPYPSAIDWDAATDATHWTKTNIRNAIYIYNASTGTYAYHCPVDSAPIDGNGGSRYIASQQSFWIQATGAPTLTARELVKASAQNPTFRNVDNSPNTSHIPMAFKDFPVPKNRNSTPNRLKLTASGNGYGDELFIHFHQGATDSFDDKYDAWKIISYSTTTPGFSSVTSVGDLAVNGLPSFSSDVNIPLRLTVPVSGTYAISRDSMLMIPLSSCVILEDKVTGDMVDLRAIVSYTFTISDTTVAPRFILHLYAPLAKNSVSSSCSNSNNGKAIAKGIGTGPWNYIWKNSAGAIVKTTTGSMIADTLFNCLPGTYSVSVNGAVCGTTADTIIVNAPQVIVNIPSQTGVSCYGGHNGSASVLTTGGTPGYSYLWSNGQSTSVVSNLSFGNYSVTITDFKGCMSACSVVITHPAFLSARYIASSYTVDIALGGNVTFSNTSLGATSYQWIFGDGSGINSSVSPMHSYSLVGSYTVTLVSYNGYCSDTTFSKIIVINSIPTGLNVNQPNTSISVVYDNGQVFLLFSLSEETRVDISIYNVLGEELFSQNNLVVKKDKIKLNFSPSSIGVYIAISEMKDAIVSKRIFIPVH
jgi:PKD repeat protein